MAGKFVVIVDAELEGIMPRYLEIRAEELLMIQQALADNDAEKISFFGHRLRGSGGGYGLERLTEMGGLLETAGDNEDFITAARAIAELAEYLEKLEIEYEEMG